MKKHLALLGAILAAGTLAAPSYAASSPYVSGNIGVSSFNDTAFKSPSTNATLAEMTFKSGIDLRCAAGLDFEDYRIEAELSYQKGDVNRGTEHGGTADMQGFKSVTSLMATGSKDRKPEGINPYLTGGLGCSRVNFDNVKVKGAPYPGLTEHHTVLGYQLGAGIGIPITREVTVDAQYRYSGHSRISMENPDFHYDFTSAGMWCLLGLRVGL